MDCIYIEVGGFAVDNESKITITRLRSMRKRHKESDGKFLLSARKLLVRNTNWLKAKCHWFKFINMHDTVTNINLRRHDEAHTGRERHMDKATLNCEDLHAITSHRLVPAVIAQ
jgi:hypothetical protein